MERKIRQIISSYILGYLLKILLTTILSLIVINIYQKYGFRLINIKFKTSIEFTFGAFILAFIFFSYKFYEKIDSLIMKDLGNIINGINYNYYTSDMSTVEFKKIQDALIDKNKKIADKENFVYSSLSYISHDMKTPITVINTNVNLIKNTRMLEGKNIERLNRIEAEANKVSDYIEKLMDVSQSFYEIEEREKIKIVDLLANLKKNVEIYSDLREEEIIFESSVGEDVYLIANMNKLQKSFVHLLNNAYEHRREYIKITTSIQDEKLLIDVIDDGLGFNDESIKKAKEIFYTDNFGRTSGKGYGIGLYYVDSYMESLSGELILQNNNYGGALQRMQIPVSRGE
ncbi:HAMP domain-containing sensor histidine kinase [uncultured Ezakiella sp.]|uniref:sensor histidine kinase n=1 Tax=uncultured Ezakiella sp. TaxID=1637529 RepID=UPI0025D9B6CA|nr:HAMP domain-containing sensor histidine kinase [uncultured Ezakiella sp.]